MKYIFGLLSCVLSGVISLYCDSCDLSNLSLVLLFNFNNIILNSITILINNDIPNIIFANRSIILISKL
ncbi:hypothetical protein OFS07_11390 [Brachyspira hyodysenteriae]|nr:hypothetical protein [Brachyspira hyodysenteriae]MDA0064364.1 hypothetical protein [Brachyspira hyodysenteriae]MDA0066867.1 hypothetical protein [Brachyspira hyodysenteriae]MDA0071944.1 hypothetical protein [Brachyspira hyodysenteriae]MDA0089821.1 hypothetical protein [Brachyspira hyodysenteriae]MDA0093656.1 hypothetical protein [Brachyspira hyodysenteriae]